MLEPMIQFVDKFITDFSWRRLAIFISLIAIVALSFMFYELQTSTNELSRYERTTAILLELDKLEGTDNPAIIEVSKAIISRLHILIQNNGLIATINISTSPEVSQSFFAALPWILLFLAFVPSVISGKEDDAYHILIGFGMVMIIIGALAYFIPTNWNNWIRYGGTQLVNFFIFVYFAYLGNK